MKIVKVKFLFCIDIDQYADSFCQEMCAYCTGICDEYGEKRYADMFWTEEFRGPNVVVAPEEYPLLSILETDDQGGLVRPYDIRESPDGKWNSVAILLDKQPTLEQCWLLKKRAIAFAHMGTSLKVLGFRLLCEETKQFALFEEEV